MSADIPLRYNISSWKQLPDVKSNNSRKLHISVTDFIQNDILSGLRISVEHDNFGTLFTCVLDASGNLITPMFDNSVHQLTTDQILQELYKYGFIVDYDPSIHLKSEQLEYLKTIDNLKFDKIRILNVWYIEHGIKKFKWQVVAFKVESHGDWLNVEYCPSQAEFLSALNNGTAINISNISNANNFQWDWLDYVANIKDILKDNGVLGDINE